MTVTQTDEDITIRKQTELKERGAASMSFSTKDKDGEKCEFDGTKVVRDIEHNIATGSITTKCGFNNDGKLEVLKTSLIFIQGQSINAELSDVWTISDDGKTLTIDSKSKSTQRTVENKMVFTKIQTK